MWRINKTNTHAKRCGEGERRRERKKLWALWPSQEQRPISWSSFFWEGHKPLPIKLLGLLWDKRNENDAHIIEECCVCLPPSQKPIAKSRQKCGWRKEKACVSIASCVVHWSCKTSTRKTPHNTAWQATSWRREERGEKRAKKTLGIVTLPKAETN